MMLTKDSLYTIATLLPLYNGITHKKEDIMDAAERAYLNTSDPDFSRELDSGGSAGRKAQAWAIQKGFDQGLVSRVRTGYYKITSHGKAYLEDCSVQLDSADINPNELRTVLTDEALGRLQSIYAANENGILERQAREVQDMLLDE